MDPITIALLTTAITSQLGSTFAKSKASKKTANYQRQVDTFEDDQMKRKLRDSRKQALAKALGITDTITPGLPKAVTTPKAPNLSNLQTFSNVSDLIGTLSAMALGAKGGAGKYKVPSPGRAGMLSKGVS